MKKRDLLFCLSFACMLPLHIYGARPIDTQAQLDRAREQQLAREARLGEGRITVQTGGLDSISGSLSSQDGYTVPAQQPAHVGPSFLALCQMLGYSPYESSLAPIIFMVGAILFAQK